MSVSYDFKGRRVLVTGGTRGLGKGIVSKFIEAGATVFALGRDQANLDKLQLEFPTVQTVCTDLENWDESRKAVAALAPIHHLVNNAGILVPETFEEIRPESIDRILAVNFKSYVNMGQVVAKGISEHGVTGATIVNISSIFDTITVAGVGMYACTKALDTMVTKVMALELGPLNIRANCIRPSFMITEMLEESKVSQTVFQSYFERQVTKRFTTVDEAADAVLYLSSEASAMVNGSSVTVDGGFYTN